jgi:hypothetical protein
MVNLLSAADPADVTTFLSRSRAIGKMRFTLCSHFREGVNMDRDRTERLLILAMIVLLLAQAAAVVWLIRGP